jgi:hypothetical protein
MRLRYWIPLVLVIDVILNVAIGLIWGWEAAAIGFLAFAAAALLPTPRDWLRGRRRAWPGHFCAARSKSEPGTAP